MDPASIAAIAGPAITAIGGLTAPDNPSPKEQAYGSLKGAFKAADEAGLHRLAVAGSPAGYSPAPSAAAEGIMAAGQQLSNSAIQASANKIPKKQQELIDAQIEETRSRTILNQANSRRALSGPQPGLGQAQQPILKALDLLASGGPRKISREPQRDQPARQTVTLGDKTAVGPNAEAFEIGLSELIAGALIYGPQWAYKGIRDAERPRRTRNSSNQDLRNPANRGQ